MKYVFLIQLLIITIITMLIIQLTKMEEFMRIVGKFTDEEIELLENIGIEIRDREYSEYEINDLGG